MEKTSLTILAFLLCLLYPTLTNASTENGIKLETGGNADNLLKGIYKTMENALSPMDDSEGSGSGDDDEDNNNKKTDSEIYSSGSGSGDGGDVIVIVSPTTTTTVSKTEKETEKVTADKTEVIDISTVTTTPGSTSRDDGSETNNEIPTDSSPKSTDPKNNVGESDDPTERQNTSNAKHEGNEHKKKEPKESGINFTIGIIVGVVVGAVLAILVIVFLVYRLRKKDEGSYSLDEQSSQAFIRDDKTGQGKEYYA